MPEPPLTATTTRRTVAMVAIYRARTSHIGPRHRSRRRAPVSWVHARPRPLDDGLERDDRAVRGGRYWDAHEALEPWWLGAEGEGPGVGGRRDPAVRRAAQGARHGLGARRPAQLRQGAAPPGLVPDRFAGTDVRELEATVHAAL
jgi:hypothetical protein